MGELTPAHATRFKLPLFTATQMENWQGGAAQAFPPDRHKKLLSATRERFSLIGEQIEPEDPEAHELRLLCRYGYHILHRADDEIARRAPYASRPIDVIGYVANEIAGLVVVQENYDEFTREGTLLTLELAVMRADCLINDILEEERNERS